MDRKQEYQNFLSVGLWLLIILLFGLQSFIGIQHAKNDADKRILRDAENKVELLSNILANQVNFNQLDSSQSNQLALNKANLDWLIELALEDERIYAISIKQGQKIVGKRRNYQWDPILWDDEIMEDAINAKKVVHLDGQMLNLEIFLAKRTYSEDYGFVVRNEILRFLLALILCILVSFLPQKLKFLWQGLKNEEQKQKKSAINLEYAILHLQKHPEQISVILELFRYAFATAPELIRHFFATNAKSDLINLGKLLQSVAPCLGAVSLQASATNLLYNLENGKDIKEVVDACARALEDVLYNKTN